MRGLEMMMYTTRGCTAALLLWALAFSASASAFEVPREAQRWKREFIKINRQVWGLENPAWLAAQIGQESSWRDGLTSSAGAAGLCQFIQGTAAGVERQYQGLASLGRYSPTWCWYANALHMRDLYKDYDDVRDRCNAMKFAGASYNGSPTTLRREIALCTADFPNCHYEWWNENVATKRDRAPHHWKENRTYVHRITQREAAYAADGWGDAFCSRPDGDPRR